ncbi:MULTISPECIES: hypothetical protein [Bacillaceae]|uniref:Atypical membrane-integrating protein (Mistic protein) n=1 Tax=Oceanobacillus caeni TaxID=405946 RepID=A0ABR5MH11_9BACI|nr:MULTISPECIES: hypothetical protein [Bacillaceae]KPH72427.1 hypothetical protein AFL42_13555 [Oceanobacillus caeni]MED4475073.1 atypical membrane-integrating protein (Mistic protein) [Oceanobacillus caeni]
MKATEIESKRFDKALDEILDLFNNLESDEPIIKYNDEVLSFIEKAKKKYGEDIVNEKVNIVVGEMLSWLDLEDVKLDKDEKEEEES